MAKQIFDFVSASAEFHTDFKYQVDSNFYLRAPSSPIIVEITAENLTHGKSQNGCFKKTKHVKFSEERTFLTPWYAHVRFSENLACFVFFKHLFWDSLFCLITDEIGLKHFVKNFLRKHYTFSFGSAPLEFTFFFFKSLKPI